ncbi:21411_t:CDS:2, partial [Gigaspora rosea]
EYRYNVIKINDGNFHSKHLKIPGCVAIDVHSRFKGFYPKAEKSSLVYYLGECGLDNKIDLPIHRMNKYYERALKETNATMAEQMHKVADYCIIDALSCQRLMIKRNVINEYRELSSIAFLSLFDAHYFAVGMKVCNLVCASAWQRGILPSTISKEGVETEKYPGAYVFPPVKGLENRRPVTAEAQRLIKRGLMPEPYLYQIPEPGERFEYIVVENNSSQKVGDKMEYPEVVRRLGKKVDINYYLKSVVGLCARFINYDDSYQPSSETLLEALKRLKGDNGADGDGADGNEADGNGVDEDGVSGDKVNEDEISKKRDTLAQKSAEKWVRGYIKNLHEGPKKDETIISYLWKEAHTYAKNLYDTTYVDKIVKCSGNDAYWSSFLSALDKQEESIRIKLTTLLAEISQDDIGSREKMYEFVTKAGKHKSKAMTLENIC